VLLALKLKVATGVLSAKFTTTSRFGGANGSGDSGYEYANNLPSGETIAELAT